jgi:hypothetical protein
MRAFGEMKSPQTTMTAAGAATASQTCAAPSVASNPQ